MSNFGTAADLAAMLQRDIDTSTANLLLDLASTAVREEVRQDIDIATTTETYDSPNVVSWLPVATSMLAVTIAQQVPVNGLLFLRELPVISVTSITEDGVTLDSASYQWNRFGRVKRLTGIWSSLNINNVVVVYSHGWATTTRQWQTARQVCLQAASRVYVNSGQLISQRVDMVHEQYNEIKLTDYEKGLLDPLRSIGQ